MSLTLQTIREAVAAQLEANLSEETNVYPYDPLGTSPQFPRIIVSPTVSGAYVNYLVAQSSVLTDVFLDLRVEVVGPDGISAGITLDQYVSRGTGNGASVVDAIESDPTLGGVVTDCEVQTVSYLVLEDRLQATITTLVRADF